MKRILLCLMMLLSICAGCAAFDPPQPPRWVWAGSDEHIGCWIDKDTARFYVGSQKAYHSNDRCANVWILSYNADKDEVQMWRCELDLNCRLIRFISLITYDSQGKVKNSDSDQYSDFREIVPNSWGEAICEMVEQIGKSK